VKTPRTILKPSIFWVNSPLPFVLVQPHNLPRAVVALQSRTWLYRVSIVLRKITHFHCSKEANSRASRPKHCTDSTKEKPCLLSTNASLILDHHTRFSRVNNTRHSRRCSEIGLAQEGAVTLTIFFLCNGQKAKRCKCLRTDPETLPVKRGSDRTDSSWQAVSALWWRLSFCARIRRCWRLPVFRSLWWTMTPFSAQRAVTC
jgi:hypothetical protein